MRTVLILGLAFVLLPSHLFARKNDWAKVEKLKPETLLRVDLLQGPTVSGFLKSADDSNLKLTLWDGTPIDDIARADVRRVIRIRRPLIRDPRKVLRLGAVGGAIVGALVLAVQDQHGCQGCKGFSMLIGGAAGAWLGFMVAVAVEIPLAIISLARHSSVVYEAASPPPARSDHGRSGLVMHSAPVF